MPNNYRTLSYARATRRGRSLGLVSNISSFQPTMISGLKNWFAVRRETAYSNGNQISSLTDWSGNGNNAAQATSGKQPIYTAAGGPNSQPFALFDTTDDVMLFTSYDLVKEHTAFMVVARTNSTSFAKVIGANVTGSKYFLGIDATTMYYSPNGFTSLSTTVTTGTFYIFCVSRCLAGMAFYKNGANLGVVGAPNDNSLDVVSALNGFSDGSVQGPGINLCEVLIYNSRLSTNDIASINAYLDGIYALY